MALGPQINTPTKAIRCQDVCRYESPRLLILFDPGHEEIVHLVAYVLGCSCRFVDRLEGAMGSLGEDEDAGTSSKMVLGVEHGTFRDLEAAQRTGRIIISTTCVDQQVTREETPTQACDYEFLYSMDNKATRRHLVRFLGFVLGEVRPREELSRKQRSNMLTMTLGDVRTGLIDLDIWTIGADAIELRVDTLRDPSTDAELDDLPSSSHIGEQIMMLKQRSDLPIVFTICMMKTSDPVALYTLLRKAIRWGCEYITVPLGLPEDLRRRLAAEKRNTKIISAWHASTAKFEWTSSEAGGLFKAGAQYADIVNMVGVAKKIEDNYSLEQFRSTVGRLYPHTMFCGLNAGDLGKLSRVMNPVLTPIHHPLLHGTAVPGQMSAAEIKSILHSISEWPALDLSIVTTANDWPPLSSFFQKLFNEMSLPHNIHSAHTSQVSQLLASPAFGGCSVKPPLEVASISRDQVQLTSAAKAIGFVDTISSHCSPEDDRTLVADNLTWRAIHDTLILDFVPSAYSGCTAIVLANEEREAAAAMFALNALRVSMVYTIGFEAENNSASNVATKRIYDLDGLRTMKTPFVVVNALPVGRGQPAATVLQLFAKKNFLPQEDMDGQVGHRDAQVYLELSPTTAAHGAHYKTGEPREVASHLGWTVYGANHIGCRFVARTLQELCK